MKKINLYSFGMILIFFVFLFIMIIGILINKKLLVSELLKIYGGASIIAVIGIGSLVFLGAICYFIYKAVSCCEEKGEEL